jgi:glycosyltransferase involved in cell wall biosynthesis
MRILLVTSEILNIDRPGGGLASFTDRFSGALVDLGHQVTILSYGPERVEVTRCGVTIEVVSVRGPKWMTLLDILTLRILAPTRTLIFRARSISRRVTELVTQGHVDIVQYPNLEALALFHPGAVPAVIRYSSDTLRWRENGGYDLDSGWSIRQRHFWECRAALAADAVYAPSRLVATVVSRRLRRRVEKIDPPVFSNVDSPDGSVLQATVGEAPFLLFVGTINRLKGIPILSEIIFAVLERYPDIHFVIAGREGQPYMAEELRQAAGKHRKRIHITGALPHSSLFAFLKRAHAVVLPSLIDNLPNTLLEAMQYGCVVIGTRGASFDEMISDGIDGFLCERNDSSSLFRAIQHLMELDPSERISMGEAAVHRVSKMAPETTIPKTIEYFETIIAGKHHQQTLSLRNPGITDDNRLSRPAP